MVDCEWHKKVEKLKLIRSRHSGNQIVMVIMGMIKISNGNGAKEGK